MAKHFITVTGTEPYGRPEKTRSWTLPMTDVEIMVSDEECIICDKRGMLVKVSHEYADHVIAMLHGHLGVINMDAAINLYERKK